MMTWINKKRNKKGFTLIELIVVVAILGILAAIAVPRFLGTQNNAKVKSHNANVKTLESAANLYVAEKPPTDDETWVSGTDTNWKNYLQEWPNPVDGVTETVYTVDIDANGNVTVKPGLARLDENVIKVKVSTAPGAADVSGD